MIASRLEPGDGNLGVALAQLRREVDDVLQADEATRLQALRGRVDDAFLRSPVAPQWEVFLARWRNGTMSGSGEDRAPVRLADVLEESPLLPNGARRSLLGAMQGIFLAAGTLGALVAIALGEATHLVTDADENRGAIGGGAAGDDGEYEG